MFVDSICDIIPMMYLPLLKDLVSLPKYNWGGTVVAHLYQNMYHACKAILSLFLFNYFLNQYKDLDG